MPTAWVAIPLSDLLVFGRRAGRRRRRIRQEDCTAPTITDSKQIEDAERELLAPFDRGEGESPYQVHRDLQDTMQNLVGIFRTEEDLRRALEELQKLKERSKHVRVEGSRMFNPGWHLARDLKCMLIVSEAVALGALARQESRGAHSRIDFPNLDPVWGAKNNVVVDDNGTMKLRQRAACRDARKICTPRTHTHTHTQKILAEEK